MVNMQPNYYLKQLSTYNICLATYARRWSRVHLFQYFQNKLQQKLNMNMPIINQAFQLVCNTAFTNKLQWSCYIFILVSLGEANNYHLLIYNWFILHVSN